MANQLPPIFDPTRFDATRTELPKLDLVRTVARASDVVIGVASSKGRPTLVGATAELEKEAGRANGGLLGLLTEQGASAEQTGWRG